MRPEAAFVPLEDLASSDESAPFTKAMIARLPGSRGFRLEQVGRIETRLAHIEAHGDARVAERSLGACFAQETRPVLGVARELVKQDLDGDHPVEAGVAGLEDHAHPTLADLLDQLVFGDAARHPVSRPRK